MSWEYVNCSQCGEDYRVNMGGSRKTREWKVENWRGVCEDCREKERIALVEKNTASNLPALTGSDKQIAWAFKIREEFISNFESCQPDMINSPLSSDFTSAVHRWLNRHIDQYDITKAATAAMTPESFEKLAHAAFETCMEEVKSHTWIDNRHEPMSHWMGEAMRNLLIESLSTDDIKQDLEAAAKAEAVMMPETPTTQTIADISIRKNRIEISFKERRDDFREIVKNHGYSWKIPWVKKLSWATGDTQDRLAEIGNALLTAGYPIRIMDEDVRTRAISGDFEPEHTRWISVTKDYPDHFYISWSYDDNLYDAAKRITGSRYDRPGVIVPIDHIDEILDFAEIYKFRFSPGGEKQIERARANQQAATIVVTVKTIDKPDLPTGKKAGIPKLAVPETVEVDDELKD